MSEIKIIKAEAYDKKIYLKFSDGIEGEFNFEDYFDYKGNLAQLNDPEFFKKIQIAQFGHNIFWPNDLDLDTDILYSVITKRPIIIENKIVFDPKLGRGAWL